jgi:hypothetical protein
MRESIQRLSSECVAAVFLTGCTDNKLSKKAGAEKSVGALEEEAQNVVIRITAS